MTWFKVDDKFAFHSKALAAGNDALGAWVRAGAWCSGELTDGAIPEHVAATIAPPDVWARLVAVRLMERTKTGYRMHDFNDYNPSASAVRAERAADKARKAAGRNRQGRGADGRVESNTTSGRNPPGRPSGVQSDVRPESTPPSAGPVPSRPDPDLTHTGRAPEPDPGPAPDDPAARDVLAALRSHKALAQVATTRTAEMVAGRLMAKPRPMPAVLRAIADVARDAEAADVAGSPWGAEFTTSKLARYLERAKAPDAEASQPARPEAPRRLTLEEKIRNMPPPPKWIRDPSEQAAWRARYRADIEAQHAAGEVH